MTPPKELRHVMEGPRPDDPRPNEESTGAGLVTVSFDAQQADLVLQRSREVMKAYSTPAQH